MTEEPHWPLFQANYPQLGFAHPCVLHILLALSAAHVARLRPQQSERYAALGELHSQYALRSTSEAIAALSATNCQAVYAASTLICLYMLGKGPSDGDCLLFGRNKGVSWGTLVQGVRNVTQLFDRSVLFSGQLLPMAQAQPAQPAETKRTSAHKEGRAAIEWENAFAELRLIITEGCAGDEDAAGYLRELESLAACYEATEGKQGSNTFEVGVENQTVLVWIWRLGDDFYTALDEHRPLALLVFAFFCPLLKTLNRQRWFTRRWPEHILSGIRGSLDTRWLPPLEWAEAQVWMQAGR